MLNILRRHHAHHSWMSLCHTHINIGDTRMWIDTAYKTDIQHPRSPNIADILPLTGYQYRVFEATHRACKSCRSAHCNSLTFRYHICSPLHTGITSIIAHNYLTNPRSPSACGIFEREPENLCLL